MVEPITEKNVVGWNSGTNGITINCSPIEFQCTLKIDPITRAVLLGYPVPKKVIFSGPCTIVFWDDDTKTIVRCSEGDTYDKEKAVSMAYLKKIFTKPGIDKLFKKLGVNDDDN